MTEIERLHPPTVAKPSGVWTPVVTVRDPGKLVFLSGFTSRNPDGEVVGVG